MQPLPRNVTALQFKWKVRLLKTRMLRVLRVVLLTVLDLCMAGYMYLLIVYPDFVRQGLIAVKQLLNK
jgi:hypothetical protein